MYRDQSIRNKFSMDLTFSVTVPLSGKPRIAGIFYGKSQTDIPQVAKGRCES